MSSASPALVPAHRTTAEMEAALDQFRSSPPDVGRVELVVARPAEGERVVLDEGELTREHGLVGDNWRDRATRSGDAPDADRQLNIINARLSGFVAVDSPGGADRRPLAGDQLHLDFDISHANLPAGSRLALGSAVIEITEPPHLGCAKFVERFGRDAMRFVNSPLGRELRLRGLNARVVVPGTVRPGDEVRKLPADAADTVAG
jgi:MOSC domain-containing protein YiiM